MTALANQWEHVELELRSASNLESSPLVLALRGLALFAREDFAGAARALNLASAADPQNALTAFFLGWAEEAAGNSRAAIGAWRNAAHLDPTLVSAHIALADTYLKLAQPELAAQALRAGLAALPDSPELRERLARIQRPSGETSPN